MNKEEWLSLIEKKLDILTEDAKKEELKKLENTFEQLKEEEKNITSIEKIQKEIFLNRGINPQKIMTKKGWVYKHLEELFEGIHNIVESMSHNSKKENIKIIIDLLVLIFFICLIKIPFILIRNLGESVFTIVEIPYALEIWSLIIDIIYIIVAIMVFINIFTKWFKNLEIKKEINKKGKSLQGITLTKED